MLRADGLPCSNDLQCASAGCRRSQLNNAWYCAGSRPPVAAFSSRILIGARLQGNGQLTAASMNASALSLSLSLLTGLGPRQVAIEQLDDGAAGVVDARLSVYVMPSEAELMTARLHAALEGSAVVLRGGWPWEVALAEAVRGVQEDAMYCARYYNPCDTSAAAFFAAFGPACSQMVARDPSACGVGGSVSDTMSGSPRASPLASPSATASRGGPPAYSWGEDTGALPRVSLSTALHAADARVGSVSELEVPALDPYSDPPSPFLTPVGLRVTCQPRGTPGAPLWPALPWALQPCVALLDAHGRTAVAADQELRVVASLEVLGPLPPAEAARLVLTGAHIVRSEAGRGGVAFRDLALSIAPNGTRVRLRFNCTMRAAVGVGLLELTGVSRPFTVIPSPTPVVVPYVREPFPPAAAAALFFVAFATVFAVWRGVLRARRARRTPARVVDEALAQAGVLAAAEAAAKRARAMPIDVLAWVKPRTNADDSQGSEVDSPTAPAGGVDASCCVLSLREQRQLAALEEIDIPPAPRLELPGAMLSFQAAQLRVLAELSHLEMDLPLAETRCRGVP